VGGLFTQVIRVVEWIGNVECSIKKVSITHLHSQCNDIAGGGLAVRLTPFT
jgi:hypothetical protein